MVISSWREGPRSCLAYCWVLGAQPTQYAWQKVPSGWVSQFEMRLHWACLDLPHCTSQMEWGETVSVALSEVPPGQHKPREMEDPTNNNYQLNYITVVVFNFQNGPVVATDSFGKGFPSLATTGEWGIKTESKRRKEHCCRGDWSMQDGISCNQLQCKHRILKEHVHAPMKIKPQNLDRG